MKLLIATPFYNVSGFSPYISSLMKTVALLQKLGIEYDYWELSGDSYIDRARNTIANTFMRSEYTHLLFIDSDMSWDLAGFGNLLKADVDVVGAGYPCKNNWDHFSCILLSEPDGKPIVNEEGLIAAWGVPTGFMKIRREAFEKLAAADPDNFYWEGQGEDAVKIYNFFGRIPPMGEDISFCRRWVEKAGGELWVEPRITMGHYGVKKWEGNYHEFLKGCPGGSEA